MGKKLWGTHFPPSFSSSHKTIPNCKSHTSLLGTHPSWKRRRESWLKHSTAGNVAAAPLPIPPHEVRERAILVHMQREIVSFSKEVVTTNSLCASSLGDMWDTAFPQEEKLGVGPTCAEISAKCKTHLNCEAQPFITGNSFCWKGAQFSHMCVQPQLTQRAKHTSPSLLNSVEPMLRASCVLKCLKAGCRGRSHEGVQALKNFQSQSQWKIITKEKKGRLVGKARLGLFKFF